MRCPICKQEIKDNSKFCGKCGNMVPRCPSCGKVVNKKVRFCVYDGTPLPTEITSMLLEEAKQEINVPKKKILLSILLSVLVLFIVAALVTIYILSDSGKIDFFNNKEDIFQNEEYEDKEITEEATSKDLDDEKDMEDEIDFIKEANIYYEKGRSYLYGLDGNEMNLQLAHENLAKAKELNNIEANFYLGVLYDWYNYPEQNYEMAKLYYEACGDNPYAKISLAFLYYYGQGVEENKTKAKDIFQSVVDAGYTEGYLGVGMIAVHEEEYDMALSFFNNVLDGTEQLYISNAMYWIGWLYGNGYGVDQDYAKQLEWCEKAAEFGDTSAMNIIGWLYVNGYGVDQDYAKALEWQKRAAELGHATAMSNVGWLYANGYGVDQNYTKALEWYEKAAELGYVTAMHWIGYLYENGYGVDKDYAKALEWYEKAAESGDEEAAEKAEAVRNILQ